LIGASSLTRRPHRFIAPCLFVIAVSTFAAPAQPSELDAASPRELIELLKANVYLTGNVVKRLAAQKRLVRLGKKDPHAVVPLVLKELSPPKSYGKIAAHQRLALIEVLRDLGPAAEAGVPHLVEILNDAEEPYDSIRMQAAAALGRIGGKEAKAAVRTYYAGIQKKYAAKATKAEARRSAAQDAFLIRQQLRSREPSDKVIAASVAGLRALGPRAAPALPTLFRAYNDKRLGSALHTALGEAIRAASGVADVETAARQAAAEAGVPDILTEIIAETRNDDSFIRGLAMTELGHMKASKPAIDATIAALRQGRNPGDAARVLGNFGRGAAPALADLSRYFDDSRAGANAIQAVGKIGVKDASIVAKLRRVLARRGHRHRGQAASTLGKLKAAEAIAELRQALADGNKYDRILSANALARIGKEAAPAMGALAATLDDPDLDVRRAAVDALGSIGKAASPAAEAITKQLSTGDNRLKRSARQALAKIGGPKAEAALRSDATRYGDADLAEARRLARTEGADRLTEFLFELPQRRALPVAQRLVTGREPDGAYGGALFLAYRGEIGPAIPILADNLARRPDGDRTMIGLAYAMLHGGDAAKLQPLLQGLRKYVEENRRRYSAGEQARLDALLGKLSRVK
jgi:HEAT repeat protein